MKKVLIALMLVVMLVLLCSCAEIKKTTIDEYELNAKVRYFDGTAEMIPLEDYYFVDGSMVKLITADGDRMYIGANNVIIIGEKVNRDEDSTRRNE